LTLTLKATTEEDKNKTLGQTRLLHFSNSQLPFHQKQSSSIIRVWSLHFTT